MIKTEELSIGDWVHSKDYNENLRVLEINCDYITLGEGFLHDYKDIEPITITPEILKKNGFESVKNIFGFKTYKLDDDFILEDRGEKKCLCRSCYKMQPSSTFWVCDIEHVHELQHALKLIGITKNIEL